MLFSGDRICPSLVFYRIYSVLCGLECMHFLKHISVLFFVCVCIPEYHYRVFRIPSYWRLQIIPLPSFFFLVFLNASHYICIVFVLCWSSQLWPYRALSLNNTTRYSLSPCHCLPPCVSADYTDLSNVTVISFSFSWSDIFDFVPGHVISASQSSVWKPCREMYSGYHTFKDFWKVHIWQSIYLVLMPDYFPP